MKGKIMQVQHPTWAVEGAEVFVVNRGNGWGVPTANAATISKITATQIQATRGNLTIPFRARYAHLDPQRVGSDYEYLVPASDPRIAQWAQQRAARDVKVETRRIVEAWSNSPSDFSKAEAAIVALQAFVATKDAE